MAEKEGEKPKAAETEKNKPAAEAKKAEGAKASPAAEAKKGEGAKAGSAVDAKKTEGPKTRAAEVEGEMRMGAVLAMGEIAILLDTYDDIFSDFDPRPYEQRELSEDFIKELNRRHWENKKGGFEVRFLIPTSEREPRQEAIIKKRLREHFEREMRDLEGQLIRRRTHGLNHLLIGMVLLGSETGLALLYPSSLVEQLVGLLLVPGGWFYVWTGMEKLVEEPFNMTQQRSFFEKFVKCNYFFVTRDPEEG